MPKKRYTPETIIRKLREVEVLQVQGHTIAQVVIQQSGKHYNTRRSHSLLSYRPPAPEVVVPMEMNAAVAIGQMAAWTNSTYGRVNVGRSLQV